jgi:hypothetical protein
VLVVAALSLVSLLRILVVPLSLVPTVSERVTGTITRGRTCFHGCAPVRCGDFHFTVNTLRRFDHRVAEWFIAPTWIEADTTMTEQDERPS